MVRIKEVHFNHDTNSVTSDAINLRLNEQPGTIIQSPEWKEDLPSRTITQSAIAYAANEIGVEISIKVKFSGNNPGQSLTVRAISSDPTKNILRNSSAKEIVFDQYGEAFDVFIFTEHKLNQPVVGIYEAALFWQYKCGDDWITFGDTSHKIYLTLKAPSAPWGIHPYENGEENTQLPWATALEFACSLAQGATNEDEVAQKITAGLYYHPLLFYTGDPILVTASFYHLSLFLCRISWGQKFPVNCEDCAFAVSTLSSLLGCNLSELEMLEEGVMVTNNVLFIGNLICLDEQSFNYHLINIKTLKGKFFVWDASLMLHRDSREPCGKANVQLPVKMSLENYVNRLISGSTRNLCLSVKLKKPIK